MNFPRSYRDAVPDNFTVDKPNPDGSETSSATQPVHSYKYLGVIFDPKLCWSLQQAKVLATATYWSS
jgi:hypothetical protein